MRVWSMGCVALLALTLAACDDQPNGNTSSGMRESAPPIARPMMMAADVSLRSGGQAFSAKSTPENGPRMQITRSYSLEISKGTVAEALEADRAACLKLGCEITAQHTSEFDGQPRATLSAQVPSNQAAAFHDHVSGAPNRAVTSFNETAQNREEQYQNIKARLERLEFMRKRLYALAEQKSDNVGDLLQVERELLRVDTDMERLTREQTGLEKVTDNVTFTLTYTLRPLKAGDVDFSPLSGLLADMANTFVWGVRMLALWTARWLPVILIVAGVWAVMRRRKHKRHHHHAEDKSQD